MGSSLERQRGHNQKREKSIHKTALGVMATRRGGESSVMLNEALLFSALPLMLLEVMD